jgi:hypothetical protein
VFVPYIYGLVALLESTIKLLANSISTGVTYPVASDSEWRVAKSIKVFSDDPLYINRVFLFLCFSSLYHRINTRFSPKYYSNSRCYDMEAGENRVRVFYGTEKREGERLEIYERDISPCNSHRVSDL